jgi:hypothetical protein
MMRLHLLAIATVLGVGACAYDPPMRADHASRAYRADLKACRASAARAASLAVSRRFPTWVAYPYTYPREDHRQIRACMTGKGYTLAG